MDVDWIHQDGSVDTVRLVSAAFPAPPGWTNGG
jgi:hypothetical protein